MTNVLSFEQKRNERIVKAAQKLLGEYEDMQPDDAVYSVEDAQRILADVEANPQDYTELLDN